MTHVTPFRKYRQHSTWPSNCNKQTVGHAYSKLFSCKPVLMVCSYRAQSNEICAYGRVSRGFLPRVCSTACCTYGQSNTTIVRSIWSRFLTYAIFLHSAVQNVPAIGQGHASLRGSEFTKPGRIWPREKYDFLSMVWKSCFVFNVGSF